jgi:hypothetical protein
VRLPAQVERSAGGDERDLEETDLEQLVEPRANTVAERDRVERGARGRVLLGGPALHLRSVGLLQPAERVGDLDAVQRLKHGD